ncbi:MAG: glycoside hydrolase family 5 protein [Treponema sp.]|nr:glycoside hydrolase family 5 protein [Treponema sp.]
MNHKKILSVFVLLSGIATVLSAAPFVFGYNEDFSVKVSVPKTNSQIQKKAAKMDTTMTALELTEKMGNGINLGNTHEAYRGWKGSVNKNVKDYEKIWGQPVTNQDMFYAYKGAGFDSVRIPVAWTNMMDYEHGDYTINVKLLDRIEEVVNYALNADLYVIINDHWDGQWWGMFGSDDKAQRTEAIKLYKSMWTQIANRFKNYDEHLIFEGANEELGGRLNDDTALSKGKKGKLSEFELYEAVKKINQCFVDVVRGTGGNNKYRFLLIPGYDTDIGRTSIPEFTMPEDKVPNRLLISVHYYTPSTYCIINEDVSWGKNKESWGTKSDIFVMNDNFRKMKRFVDAGYGVIIGEYGVARSKNGKMKENTVDWMSAVLDQCDKYNYCPMLWDCNTFFKKNDPMGFDNEEMKQLYLNRRYKPEE